MPLTDHVLLTVSHAVKTDFAPRYYIPFYSTKPSENLGSFFSLLEKARKRKRYYISLLTVRPRIWFTVDMCMAAGKPDFKRLCGRGWNERKVTFGNSLTKNTDYLTTSLH